MSTTNTNTIKMADALLITAETVAKLAKQAGLSVHVMDLYKTLDLTDLALVAGMMINLAEKASKTKIEITKQ